MPLTIALEALKAAYRGQCSWLTAWANELEAGRIRVVSGSNSVSIDITAQTARDYRHRAHNLEAIIAAYDRLVAKSALAAFGAFLEKLHVCGKRRTMRRSFLPNKHRHDLNYLSFRNVSPVCAY